MSCRSFGSYFGVLLDSSLLITLSFLECDASLFVVLVMQATCILNCQLLGVHPFFNKVKHADDDKVGNYKGDSSILQRFQDNVEHLQEGKVRSIAEKSK